MSTGFPNSNVLISDMINNENFQCEIGTWSAEVSDEIKSVKESEECAEILGCEEDSVGSKYFVVRARVNDGVDKASIIDSGARHTIINESPELYPPDSTTICLISVAVLSYISVVILG